MNKSRREAIKQAKKDVMDLRRKLWDGERNYESPIQWSLVEAEKHLNDLRCSPNLWYAEERLTHGYDDGWAHLDKWGPGVTFITLKISDPVYTDPFYGEAWMRRYTLKVVGNPDEALVMNVLKSAFMWSCRCEHDCCGHTRSYLSDAKRVKRKEWLVEVNYRINC